MNWYKRALIEEADDGGLPEGDKWIPVESSWLSDIAYYEPLGMLEFRLKNGKEYGFANVPASIFTGLMTAKSKGQFYNNKIRNKFKQV